MKRKLLLIGVFVGVGITIISLTPFVDVPDYRVEIDAVKVQDLVAISNVRVTNTGKLPLTKISVNMSSDDIQFFEKLEPGKTVWVSPKAEVLDSVTISTAEGVVITKDFREPVSMVAFGPG